jgi:hypothetical protein
METNRSSFDIRMLWEARDPERLVDRIADSQLVIFSAEPAPRHEGGQGVLPLGQGNHGLPA